MKLFGMPSTRNSSFAFLPGSSSGTIERTRGRLRRTASRPRIVAEQYQLRVVIRNMLLLREQLVPGMLHVVDHEGDELNFLLLPSGSRAGRPHRVRCVRGAGKQTVPENKPEDEQQHRTANAQMEAAESPESAKCRPAA